MLDRNNRMTRLITAALAIAAIAPTAAVARPMAKGPYGMTTATGPQQTVKAKGPYGITTATGPQQTVKAKGPYGITTATGPRQDTTRATAHPAGVSRRDGMNGWRTAAISEAALLIAALALGSALLLRARRRAPRMGI
jgi:hypothetical protein